MTEELENTLSNTGEDLSSADTSDVPDDGASGEGAGDPVSVVSVDELLSRLDSLRDSTESGSNDDNVDEEPVIDIVDVALDILDELQSEGTYREQVESLLTDIRDHQVRPAMTTDFSDYTVSESLLLLLLIYFVINSCVKMLKGGFSWLLP